MEGYRRKPRRDAVHKGVWGYQKNVKERTKRRQRLVLRKNKAHSYRRAFFPKFPKFGNNWTYVSIYGGVLSLFVKFSKSKNIKFVTIPIFGKKKNQENTED